MGGKLETHKCLTAKKTVNDHRGSWHLCRWMILLVIIIYLFSVTRLCSADISVNYRLKWLFNASVIGDIYAKEQGFFRGAGLDVTVKAGGPERDAIRELEMGYAGFGVASADQVIRAREKGAPVVVIAQLFQVNPLQWIYRAGGKNYTAPSDFKGSIVGITYGGNDETILRTLLARAGLSDDDLRFFSVRYDYTPFYMGKVDLWPVYRNAQGIILKEKLKREGEEIRFFIPSEHGVDFVANSVVTSETMLKEHPDMVKKFKSALLGGWRAAFQSENREKSLAILRKYDRDTSAEIQIQQLEATFELVWPDTSIPFGTINVKAWKQTEQIMLERKLIKNAVNVEACLLPEG